MENITQNPPRAQVPGEDFRYFELTNHSCRFPENTARFAPPLRLRFCWQCIAYFVRLRPAHHGLEIETREPQCSWIELKAVPFAGFLVETGLTELHTCHEVAG